MRSYTCRTGGSPPIRLVDTLPPVSQRLMAQEGFEDELARYALAFLDAVAPSVSNAVEAFAGAEAVNREGVITGSLRALTFVTGRQRDGAFLEIELEPVRANRLLSPRAGHASTPMGTKPVFCQGAFS